MGNAFKQLRESR